MRNDYRIPARPIEIGYLLFFFLRQLEYVAAVYYMAYIAVLEAVRCSPRDDGTPRTVAIDLVRQAATETYRRS